MTSTCPRAAHDLAVSKPRLGTHDAFEERGSRDLAFAIHPHFTDHAQPIDLGIQRTQPVGQNLRQHRHDAVREIDRRTATSRLRIQRGADVHVVRDVGYRNQQAPAAAGFFTEDGVVKISRIGAVDRYEVDAAQVDPALLRPGRHRIAKLLISPSTAFGHLKGMAFE